MTIRFLPFAALLVLSFVASPSFAGSPAVPGELTEAVCLGNVPLQCQEYGTIVVVSYHFDGLGPDGCKANPKDVILHCIDALGLQGSRFVGAKARFNLTRNNNGVTEQYVQNYNISAPFGSMGYSAHMKRGWDRM